MNEPRGIRDHRRRAMLERKWWSELKHLSDSDDVTGFYRHYAKYLESNNVISHRRNAIYRMANKAVELLESGE